METKDYLLEIYKVEADKYNKTRDIHWRLNFAVWTVLIIAIYSKIQQNFNLDKLSDWSMCAIYLVYLALHLVFIKKIHGSLDRSLARMHDIAQKVLSPELDWSNIGNVKKKVEKQKRKLSFRWEYLQVFITIFLLLIFHFLAGHLVEAQKIPLSY